MHLLLRLQVSLFFLSSEAKHWLNQIYRDGQRVSMFRNAEHILQSWEASRITDSRSMRKKEDEVRVRIGIIPGSVSPSHFCSLVSAWHVFLYVYATWRGFHVGWCIKVWQEVQLVWHLSSLEDTEKETLRRVTIVREMKRHKKREKHTQEPNALR
jgi:hypothetical protein